MHALEAMKKGESKDLIARLLGEPVKCYTTPCVQHELKKMGKEVAGARLLLKRYPLHKCGHEERCSAAECLLAQLGTKNEEHFFVATQDRRLQRQCMAVAGGAVLYASVNGVHLEAPSATQKEAVAQEEQQHLLPSQAELLAPVLQELAEDQQAQHAQHAQQRDRPQLRHKRAKGPNPLAALPKKKKKAAGGAAAGGGQEVAAGASGAGGGREEQGGKRKRQRGRSGKGGGGDGGGSD